MNRSYKHYKVKLSLKDRNCNCYKIILSTFKRQKITLYKIIQEQTRYELHKIQKSD